MDLTIREVQKKTGLSYCTIRKAIERGEIKAKMLNGRPYIPDSEVTKLPNRISAE